MEIKSEKKDLEKALGSLGKKDAKAKDMPTISKEEETGFHKGSLNTLVAERNELIKMVANVEALMKMHLKRLEELGVKIEFERPKEK